MKEMCFGLLEDEKEEKKLVPSMQEIIYEAMEVNLQMWEFARTLSAENLMSQFRKKRELRIKKAETLKKAKKATNPKKALDRSKQLQVLNNLKLPQIQDPIGGQHDDEKFARIIASTSSRIRSILSQNAWSSGLGISYLMQLLDVGKRLIIEEYKESTEFKNGVDNDDLKVYDRAVEKLVGRVSNRDYWRSAWLALKSKANKTVSQLWSAYANLRSQFPKRAAERSRLEDLRELLPTLTHYTSIVPFLELREETKEFVSASGLVEFWTKHEKRLTQSSGFSVDQVNTDDPTRTPGRGRGNCNQWTRGGSCSYGSRCRFVHVGVGNSGPTPERKVTQVCESFFNDGKCSRGRSCMMPHMNPREVNALPRTGHCLVCATPVNGNFRMCRNHWQRSREYRRATGGIRGRGLNNGGGRGWNRGRGRGNGSVGNFSQPVNTAAFQTMCQSLGEMARNFAQIAPQSQQTPPQLSQPIIQNQHQQPIIPQQHQQQSPNQPVIQNQHQQQSPNSLGQANVNVVTVNEYASEMKRNDMRLYAEIAGCGSRVLLDTGGQASICGREVFNHLVFGSESSVAQTAIPVSGIGGKVFQVTKQLTAKMKMTSGVYLECTFLLCDGFKGAIMGFPDLRKNKIEFRLRGQNYNAEIGGKSVSSGSTRSLGSVKIYPIDMEELQVARFNIGSVGIKPSETFLLDPGDLLTANDEPSMEPEIVRRARGEKINLPPAVASLRFNGKTSDYFKGEDMRKFIDDFLLDVDNDRTNLTRTQANQFVHLFARFQTRFVKRLPVIGGLGKDHEFRLEDQLKVDPKMLPMSRPMKLSEPKAGYMEKALMQDVKDGLRFIPDQGDVLSTTPCFPIFEKDKIRTVGNYIKINEVTKLDPYPSPTVPRTIHKLMSSKYLAAFDGKSGYNQILKSPLTVMMTVWITMQCLYASWGMDFGLKNAGPFFIRVMQKIFGEIDSIDTHVDDLYAKGNDFRSFFESCAALMAASEKANLFLKLQKIQVAPRRLKGLGHIYERGGYRPDPDRFKALLNIAPARTVRQTQCMLGLFVFWAKFLNNLHKLNEPIRDLIKNSKGTKVTWTQEAQVALEGIQKDLQKKAFLDFPDYKAISEEQPFDIYVDANSCAMGYVLVQFIRKKPYLLKCGSKTFRPHERNWEINRKELCAATWALGETRELTAHRPKRLNFDSKNMDFYSGKAMRVLTPVYSRLAMHLETHEPLQKRFVKGITNVVADFFTRYTTNTVDAKVPAPTVAEVFPDLVTAAKSYEFQHGVSVKAVKVVQDVKCENPSSALFPDDADVLNYEDCIPKMVEYHLIRPARDGVTVAASAVTFEAFPDLIKDQKTCEKIQTIMKILEDPGHKNYRQREIHFRIEGGVLMHISASPDPKTNKRWTQVVVPESHYRAVYEAFHCVDIAAHRGYRATYASILTTYFWPSMGVWIKRAVAECDICIRVRKPLPKVAYVTPPVPAYGEVWSVDYVGPYPVTPSGFSYVLTFTERSTYWAEAFPTTAPDSRNVAKKYCQDIIPRHGAAKMFISDLGAPFISSVMKHINTRLGTKHHFASSGNSRGNSIHEVRHRPMTAGIIANLLQHKASNGNWAKYLPPALFMLRNGIPAGRDFSPAELRTGKRLWFPADLQPSVIQGRRDLRAVCSDVEDFFAKMAEMRKIAAQADVEYRTAVGDQQYTHKIEDIKVGNIVWLRWKVGRDDEKVAKKLDVNWIGPYFVIEEVPPSSFTLQHSESGRKTKPIHLRQLSKASPKPIGTIKAVAPRPEEQILEDPVDDLVDEKKEFEQKAEARFIARPSRTRRRPSTLAPMIRNDPHWQDYDAKALIDVSMFGIRPSVLFRSRKGIIHVAQLQTYSDNEATIKLFRNGKVQIQVVKDINNRIFKYDPYLVDSKFEKVSSNLQHFVW
jgi:hypothetical protein